MSGHPWNGVERRIEPLTTADRRHDAEAHTRSSDHLINHVDSRFDELKDYFKSGFPGGDIEGHRRDHEQEQEIRAAKARLWSAVQEKLVSGSIWLALGTLAMAMWDYIRARV